MAWELPRTNATEIVSYQVRTKLGAHHFAEQDIAVSVRGEAIL
jgi:hypothetical protein